MTTKENFIDKLFVTAINGLCSTKWDWPPGWDIERKRNFLKQCIEYAERQEWYEQCAIIRDVQKELEADI
jgi:hypothetical protein